MLRMAGIPLVGERKDSHRELMDAFDAMPRLCFEKDLVCIYMCYVLRKCGGNRSKAARILGMEGRNVRFRITKMRKQGYIIPPSYYYVADSKLNRHRLYQKRCFKRFLSENQCQPYDHIAKPYVVRRGHRG